MTTTHTVHSLFEALPSTTTQLTTHLISYTAIGQTVARISPHNTHPSFLSFRHLLYQEGASHGAMHTQTKKAFILNFLFYLLSFYIAALSVGWWQACIARSFTG